MNFRKQDRLATLQNAQDIVFDLVIIGGGITGAGIAVDASGRGVSTFLLEKGDFAEGTSSKSTKLVHGGLRYLKNFEITLVRDAGRERAILYQNAPHIVRPQKMILPIYKGQKYGKLISLLGLWIYDLLAGVKKEYRKKTLSVEQIKKYLPTIKRKNLRGGIEYYEYRTNDGRLVIENIKKAVEQGTYALNYAEVTYLNNDGDFTNIKFFDKVSRKEYQIRAKTVVNATGVWADILLTKNKISERKYILPSKGIHILVDQSKIAINTSVYFELEDHRMVFAIPSGGKVYIGTTDEEYAESLDEVFATYSEIDYLLDAFNFYFDAKLKLEDIEITWAGIRPLVSTSTKKLQKVSRKEEIIIHNEKMISVLGGKLTAYRLMAERAVDQIVRMLGDHQKYSVCNTKNIRLSGAEFDFDYVEDYKIIEYAEKRFYEAYQLNADTKLIYNLFYTYGKNIELIIEKAFDIYNTLEDRSMVWLEAEIWYVSNYEMLINLSDFMIRRTERFYFTQKDSCLQIETIAKIIVKYINWTEEELREQIKNYNNITKKNHSFVNLDD